MKQEKNTDNEVGSWGDFFCSPTFKILLLFFGLMLVSNIYFTNKIISELQPWMMSEVKRETQRQSFDLECVMDRIAGEQTALFVMEKMSTVKGYRGGRDELFNHSISEAKIEGHFCEFGVASGTTINYIASKTDRTVHGFDSFEGLPENWRNDFEKGYFKRTGLPQVRSNVQLYKGWFDKTLPIWSKEHPGPVAFLHLDADLYSSTKTVFDSIGHQIVPGTVIQFDEYFNYPNWQQGEYKAFQEFVAKRGVEFEYIGFCIDFQQVAVKIISLKPIK